MAKDRILASLRGKPTSALFKGTEERFLSPATLCFERVKHSGIITYATKTSHRD